MDAATSPTVLLSQIATSATLQRMPAAAIRAAKWSLLDALGVMLGATGLERACEPFSRLARDVSGDAGTCLLLGTDVRVSAPLAAFANGALAHALDYEDAYDGAPLHPNAALVPAALAMTQHLGGISGAELLIALIVGSDITCRLGLALEASPEDWGWYPPPLLNTFGAATAAGRVASLSAAQMIDAWSLGICQNAISKEFKRTADSPLRAVREAFPAQAGWTGAALARSGARGFDHPLEGEAGFFRLYAGNKYSREGLVRDAGIVFEGANVSYKPWPSCRGTHAYVEAALDWHQDGVRADDVGEIRMLGGTLQQMLGEPLERKRAPVTAIDAKFSAPFCVASALVHGELKLESFAPAALTEPPVLMLARKASLSVDRASAAEDDLVAGTTALKLHGGRTLKRRIEHPLGSAFKPLSEAQLIAKFRNCAAHARQRLRPQSEQALIDTVLHLEEVANLESTLFTRLQDFEY
jgi:2-methylcitrate dehydratase PrpD